MAKPGASKSISHELAWTLEHLYRTGVEECAKRGELRKGRNAYWHHGLAIFPLAVNAYQARFNEFIYFSRLSMFKEQHGELGAAIKAHIDSFQEMNLEEQSILLPRLLTGSTFKRGEQPFQDFVALVKIRNALVHFRMDVAPVATVEHLAQRGFAFPAIEGNLHRMWTDQLSTLECSRWAINTVVAMTLALTSLFGVPSGLGGVVLTDDEADAIVAKAISKSS